MALLTYAHRTYLLVSADRAALMSHTGSVATLGTLQHDIRDMDRHRLLDNATLACLALRFHMLLHHIQAFNNYLACLWECPRYSPFLSLVLTSQNDDGVALLNIHFI